MVIDKSWICLGHHEKAFFTGLKKFIEHCKPLVNSSENVKCTCKSCRNVSWVSIPELPRHITNNGRDPSYKTWTNHGEPNVLPPVIHNTTQPQMRSYMTACLDDLSYIPLNNKQNKPTQGDISKTSNEPTQAIRSEFEELYASANEELYPEFFQNVFPSTKGYKLPPSYYAIKKTFKTIGLGYESMHACVNDCFLFWGEDHKHKQSCPVCNTSRWKDDNTPGKKVPKKNKKCSIKFVADGFNPFDNLSQSYSMWPVILTTYNLPPWLCMKESSFMLTLLIPGPKSPGKDIDVYLRPLIDDLKDLWAKPGVETIYVATCQKFNMRAMVLWTINDFPARSSLSGWSGQDVAKPIIKLCLFFKQIYSQTLMEDDMLKAQSKVIDILCNLELIYPTGFFDIMIHLVIHLPLEALEGEPIRPWWISHYFRDVTMKFNRLNRNADCPPPTCQFKVFRSICKSIGLRPVIRIDHQELKKVIWYVLHNSPEIDTYRVKFKRRPLGWKVVEHVNHKKFSNGGVTVVKDDPNIIHIDNSSDLALTTTLNDLEILALHINGQSIDVDAPLDIIDVDEDDDIIDDEDVLPYDLTDSDDEDLVNVDDDDGMSADVVRGHGGDSGGDDRPPPHESAGGCRGKGTRKPNLGGRKVGRMHTRKETRNLGLRKITDELGPQPIRFEWKDNDMMLPLGEHSVHWANLPGEIVREFSMHFGSWRNIRLKRKAGVLEKIGIRFWSDPKNMAWYAQNAQNQAKSTVICRQGSQTLTALRDMQEKMVRVQGLGTYTDDQIMAMVGRGKQRGHSLGVGRVLAGRGNDVLDVPVPRCNHTSDVDELKRSNKQLQKHIDMITKAIDMC
nr:hypothetical protein [Tanacetum cinerariifolium]